MVDESPILPVEDEIAILEGPFIRNPVDIIEGQLHHRMGLSLFLVTRDVDHIHDPPPQLLLDLHLIHAEKEIPAPVFIQHVIVHNEMDRHTTGAVGMENDVFLVIHTSRHGQDANRQKAEHPLFHLSLLVCQRTRARRIRNCVKVILAHHPGILSSNF